MWLYIFWQPWPLATLPVCLFSALSKSSVFKYNPKRKQISEYTVGERRRDLCNTDMVKEGKKKSLSSLYFKLFSSSCFSSSSCSFSFSKYFLHFTQQLDSAQLAEIHLVHPVFLSMCHVYGGGGRKKRQRASCQIPQRL